jgi:hypothetical protein
MEDTWKYDIENTGTNWMNTGYDDSGWSTGNGVFGEESKAAQYGYSITTPIAYTSMSMFFRKTFTVCDPMEVTGLTLNSLFDDGMVVYVNGTRVYSKLVSGDPPPYDGGITTCCHEAVNYESKDLTSVIGLSALRGLLTAGSNNVLAVGVYNDVPISSDIVWDGELVINHNASGNVNVLFSGNETQAQSVDTTGWTDGVKDLQVTGDDATCLTPLPPANNTFTYLH